MCEQLSSSAIETFRESAASILKNENTLDRLGELATVLREIRAKRIEMENLKPNSDVKWRGVSSWRSLVSRTPSPSSSRHGSRSASPGPKSSGGYAEKDALQSDIHRLKEDARLRIRGLPEDLRHSIVMAEYENVDEADPGQCAGIDAICSDLRDSINQAYFNAFDPLPFGLFSEEDELRMRWQDSTAALLKCKQTIRQVHEAGPMLQQATTALECIMSSAHDGQNSKMAGQEAFSSLILADTALHTAWNNLSEADFGLGSLPNLSAIPDTSASSMPFAQVRRIAQHLQPAVAALVDATRDYKRASKQEVARLQAIDDEIAARLTRARRRILMRCCSDVEGLAPGAATNGRSFDDLPPQYEAVPAYETQAERDTTVTPTDAPPSYTLALQALQHCYEGRSI